MDWHQMKNSPRLQDVPLGKYDWYLDDWIKGLKEFKTPIFIRLSHEMDGDWYPYSEGYKPEPDPQHRGGLRCILAIYRQPLSAKPACHQRRLGLVRQRRPIRRERPGPTTTPAMITWIGSASTLYSARNPRDVVKQFLDLYGKTGKPIMIPEGGTGEDSTRWNTKFAGNAAWTKELFDTIDETPPDQALCWFEWDDTWNLTRDPAQLAEFRRRIAAKRYVGKFAEGEAVRGSKKP